MPKGISLVWRMPAIRANGSASVSKHRKDTPKAHKHTNQEWLARRDRIEELFDTHELSEVAKIMAEEGFHASVPQYKNHLKSWGSWKYLKLSNEQMSYIKTKTMQRALQGKSRVAVRVNGKKIASAKLSKILKSLFRESAHERKTGSQFPPEKPLKDIIATQGLEFDLENPPFPSNFDDVFEEIQASLNAEEVFFHDDLDISFDGALPHPQTDWLSPISSDSNIIEDLNLELYRGPLDDDTTFVNMRHLEAIREIDYPYADGTFPYWPSPDDINDASTGTAYPPKKAMKSKRTWARTSRISIYTCSSRGASVPSLRSVHLEPAPASVVNEGDLMVSP